MGQLLDRPLENGTLVWPQPPYFNYAPSVDKPLLEECIIELAGMGRPLAGHLIRFSPEESRLLFQPISSNLHQIISFSKIKNLQLLWPTQLIPEQAFLEARAQETFPTTTAQPFEVQFVEGTNLSGKTLGHLIDKDGLYLYPTLKSGHVERHFIPQHAIKHYQVGSQIGEILIEENLAATEDIALALEHQKSLRSKRIGDYLNENQILSAEELHKALSLQENQPVLKLGEALKELQLLSDEQLETALNKQKENRHLRLGQILVEMGIVDDRTLKGTLAKKLGIPYVNLAKFNFDPNAIRLIPAPLAKKLCLIPLCNHESMLVVALEDPMNFKAIDEIRFLTQLKVLPAMASREDILEAIQSHYGADADVSSELYSSDGSIDFDFESDAPGINDLANRLFDEEKSMVQEAKDEPTIVESDNTLVQLVNKMILDAHKEGASDIHIETYADKKNTIVRFRKDGSLTPYLEIPANFRNALISRIKIMSNLDISERRKPQDGKLDFKNFGPVKIELRVATIPTANNLEDVVMRVLASSKPIPMEKLGLSETSLKIMQKIVAKTYGLVLVCGPTGSGKTTTLHSILGHINTPDRKIWTAEDPIEITQKGLRQVQVNPKIDWTFANAMRSFLRADPDVIMVGEMRDAETTKIGIEASLTGHLVFSTLHTNSAPESIVRMLDLGMDPFNFADALLGILAQRLAKSLCPECKIAHEATNDEIEALLLEYLENTPLEKDVILKNWQQKYQNKKGKFTLHRAKGCKVCNQTGYKGRVGLYELMTVSPNLRHLIQQRAVVSEIAKEAMLEGMLTLKQDGIEKVLQGITDIAQVRAVCA